MIMPCSLHSHQAPVQAGAGQCAWMGLGWLQSSSFSSSFAGLPPASKTGGGQGGSGKTGSVDFVLCTNSGQKEALLWVVGSRICSHRGQGAPAARSSSQSHTAGRAVSSTGLVRRNGAKALAGVMWASSVGAREVMLVRADGGLG